jgi:hypothetical protein
LRIDVGEGDVDLEREGSAGSTIARSTLTCSNDQQ